MTKKKKKPAPTGRPKKKPVAKISTPAVRVPRIDGRDNRFSVTQKEIEEALIKSRGDILVASKLMRMSVRELDNILRAIPGIPALLGTIEEIKADNPEYSRMSGEWFERQCTRAVSLYRLAALEALNDLATMPMTDKAAMMNVKREAAVNLWGGGKDGSTGVAGELTEFFKALDQDYREKKDTVTRIRLSIERGPAAAVAGPIQTVLPPLDEPEPVATQDRS